MAGHTGLASDGLAKRATEKFHVFTWIETVQVQAGTSAANVKLDALTQQLQEVENFLITSTKFSDKRAYEGVREEKRVSSCQYLEKVGLRMENKKGQPRPLRRKQYEERIDIFNAADIIFRFFLPLGYDGPTVKKFWGAVRILVQVSRKYMPTKKKSRGPNEAD